MLLSACGGKETSSTSSSDNSSGKSGGDTELTYVSLTDVVGLSPILTNDSASANVINQVYETLFKRNPETLEIEPLLAESYEQPDENTWIFHLKQDITFHDGTPFNGEAVKYTFEKIRDPETASPRASLMEPIDTITVVDDYTVKITTKYPYGSFLASLAHENTAIVSPTADKKQDLMKEPVGTGPFKFVSWTSGDQVVLEANSDYHDGEPELKKVTFKVVPEISTAISMLQAGEAQFVDNIPVEQMSRVESLNNVNVDNIDGTSVYYLTFNFSKEDNQDSEFRKAVASAIDRDAIISKLGGLGIKSDSILGPKVFGYKNSEDNAGTPYDLNTAKELVKKNGYDKREVTLLTPNRGNFQLMAEVVQAQLADAGFKVKIENMEWATYLEAAKTGKYDLIFLSWANVTGDGSEMFYPNFHSDNIGSSNRAQYDNPEFDKIVENSRTTTDQEKRLEYLDQANKVLLDDNAAIVLYHGKVTTALDKSYSGLTVDPNGIWDLAKVTRK